jgi:tetratricopeptide (TPR) repeat protein
MNRFNKLAFAALPLTIALLAGCGTTSGNNTNTATSNTTASNATSSNTVTKTTPSGGKVMIVGGQSYSGSANLKKYEDTAKNKPDNADAQIQAGVSAHVNGQDDLAIGYYQKAIKLDPKSGVAYNNIGNIYFRVKNDAKQAVTYYQKATEVQPTYLYGWWNLALAQQKLGQNTAAKGTLQQGMKAVPTSDPNYKNLQNMLKTMK